MAKIWGSLKLLEVSIKILPAFFDGGQTGRTVGSAKGGNETRDPEDASARSTLQRSQLAGEGTASPFPRLNFSILYVLK